MDPTPNVNTGEGLRVILHFFVVGLKNHFVYWHYAQSSKRITKIASIKQKANNAKKGKSHYVEGNLNTNSSSIVAGLLMSKHSKKNGLEMIIDDYSGTLSALATTEELKKQASMITFDQMVMLEVESNNERNSRFCYKESDFARYS